MSENPYISSLQCPPILNDTVTCPSNITPGSTVTFNVSWLGGQAPFEVYLYKDSDINSFASATNIPAGTVSIPATINWTPGTHTVKATIVDMCIPTQTSYPTCSTQVSSHGQSCILGVCLSKTLTYSILGIGAIYLYLKMKK